MLLLGVGAATTSCEDMFTAENRLVTTDLAPKDTLYQVMGIVQRMQKLADRTVLLGELRADLVEIDPIHSSLDLQELSANNVSSANIYNQPVDYYAVINNCNIYLANVDTMRYGQGTRKYFEKEVCAVKCFRAWCYLELLKVYGEVPFITEPVLTSDQAENIVLSGQKADMKTILDFCIEDLKKYPYMNENNELRQAYGDHSYAGIRYRDIFMPVRALLAELYLWRGSYTGDQNDYVNAVRMYHNYFTFPGEELYTSDGASSWNDREFARDPSTGYAGNFGTSTYAGILPLDTTAYYGNVTDIRAVFNSQYSNKYYPAVAPSERVKDISRNQLYCKYIYDNNIADTLYASQDVNDYEEKVMAGDLRLYSVWNITSNFRESQYHADVNPMKYSIAKYGRSLSTDVKQAYVPLLPRRSIMYLHMAEALNRAGFPETAFAVLKYGISHYTLTDRKIVSQEEYDRLCEIKSWGFTAQEPAYADNPEAQGKTASSFVIWPSTVFGTEDRSTTPVQILGGSRIQFGIHSLGSGDVEFNKYYALDDSVTIEALEPHMIVPDTVVLDRTSTAEDSVLWMESLPPYYEAIAYNDSIDSVNVAYLATPEVRERRQAHVSKLLLEEEALEGMFEGYRFYDVMRYQMQESAGAGIGQIITMPAFIEEKYGTTTSMAGKPWYLTLPAR
jgi:hypothetical protein